MLKNLFAFFLLIALGSTSAQSFISSLTALNYPVPVNSVVDDTLRILGVMVNFQEDRDESTFGNGKFGTIYTQDYGNTILDPLPHDQPYFEAHLEFVKNYYDKVSGNRLLIEYYIFPDTFSVSMTMRNYSPPANSNDFSPLAQFADEVWKIADSIYPRFDLSHFDLFSIFHAGVGRDITLPGSLGNERDLPSVYLGINTLKGIYGENFEGFTLPNNSFKIPNTMIIPETESRELSSFGNTFLFEITINGLLVANVASHLGLPDLFDTNTGLSAIGRFGLMDGQSIFAYNGLFPPEPSPWEKIYMGWTDFVELPPGDFNINLAAKLSASLSDTVIIKVPINSTEYFLVENRNRDTRGDGAVLTYILDGETRTKTFTKDTTGFYSYSVDSVSGVVIDVDEFDWALPGSGILIWHIDENIISQKLAANTINNDKFNRGVDVEEADGIQDIGERFLTIFGDEIIGEGTSDDFWYAENPSDLYTNTFSKNTRPDSKTNSGANSLVTIHEFQSIANKMVFRVTFGDSIVKPLFSVKAHDGTAQNNNLTVIDSSGYPHFSVTSNSDLYRFDEEGVLENSISSFSKFKPAAVVVGGKDYHFGVQDNSFSILEKGVPILNSVNVNGIITAPPVIRKTLSEQNDLLIGTASGKIFIYGLSQLPSTAPVLRDSILFSENYSIRQIAASDFYTAAIASNNDPSSNERFRLFDNEGNNHLLPVTGFNGFAVTKNKSGADILIVLSDDNNFITYSLDKQINNFVYPGSTVISSFSVADINQDGENYILFNSDRLYALNSTGVTADNFPVEDPLGVGFEGLPLAADFEGDGRSEIITFTKDGRIFAVDGGSAKIINGFPLDAGSALISSPALFNYREKTSLAVLTGENYLYAWSIGSTLGTHFWAEEFADNMNTSFTPAAESQNLISEFFPKNRAYNYPNPVYDGRTFIRYYVSESSKISIKIFDLAGDFVAELNDDAEGGLDNETEWIVDSIQSGVYLARIEASSLSGKSESTIIKIAVVK